MEKWDLVARASDNTTISCSIARNPMRPAATDDWCLEELYD